MSFSDTKARAFAGLRPGSGPPPFPGFPFPALSGIQKEDSPACIFF